MRRLLLTIAMISGLAVAVWAQDSADDSGAEEAEQARSEAEATDDSDLDEQSYADSEDDDFRPSEEIPADQSIPFPTDI